jgi:hypothetical protein
MDGWMNGWLDYWNSQPCGTDPFIQLSKHPFIHSSIVLRVSLRRLLHRFQRIFKISAGLGHVGRIENCRDDADSSCSGRQYLVQVA